MAWRRGRQWESIVGAHLLFRGRQMHPDRRKQKEVLTVEEEGKIDLEAKLVGRVADVLSDPKARLGYDCLVRR